MTLPYMIHRMQRAAEPMQYAGTAEALVGGSTSFRSGYALMGVGRTDFCNVSEFCTKQIWQTNTFGLKSAVKTCIGQERDVSYLLVSSFNYVCLQQLRQL
jgi:hypothetical protein